MKAVRLRETDKQIWDIFIFNIDNVIIFKAFFKTRPGREQHLPIQTVLLDSLPGISLGGTLLPLAVT
jgi:hypothetical protein